ncbi:MAG TPA: L,D-transpeptidase family protein [Ilumatobacteraceae bacterium]|nr:L,D-transpeptidase family protein [Ilumatobacteraceae bacterium]
MDRRWLSAAISMTLVGTAVAASDVRSTAAAAPIAPATAAGPASRDIAFAPDAQCDITTARALSVRHPQSRQFVIVESVTATATTGSLQIVGRSITGQWRCQQGPVVARLGKSGVRVLAERRSGDGTTPAGVFPLGSVRAWDGQRFQFFGNRPDPGVRGLYRNVRREDCWGATPQSPIYQQVVDRPGCTAPDEWLTSIGDVYEFAAVIGANLDPVSGDAPGEPALAAAIFLHRNAYSASGLSRPTSGCVSLTDDDLRIALRLIDPDLDVQFAIGEVEFLRRSG